MINKNIFYLLATGLIFLTLVFYNYRNVQRNLSQSRPSQLSISFLTSPLNAKTNTPVNFHWRVEAPISFAATTTTIFWGYDSTPSALTKLDSPRAVAYPNYAPDYVSGRFSLPSDFDLNLTFPKAGKVFLRAYALVGNDYLWTAEQSLDVK